MLKSTYNKYHLITFGIIKNNRMKNLNKNLYAIFKNEKHMGNERGVSKKEAIKLYLITAGYSSLIKEIELTKNYSAEIAINKIHYY